MTKEFKYIYGPVPSWRLGKSLGIDVLSQPAKICNFDCVYCQLGKTGYCPADRQDYVPDCAIIKELDSLPETPIDYITFSGRGEATLAANLEQTALEVKKLRKEPIALITNAVLLTDAQVRKELLCFDFIVAKLDAVSDSQLAAINRPMGKIRLADIVDGFCAFRAQYSGKLAVQTMLIQENINSLTDFAELYRRILPDEIQLNTPLRPSPVKPLSEGVITEFKAKLAALLPDSEIKTVYETEKPQVTPLSKPDTLKRRGKI